MDLFEGARVLDIASHDGRWSTAALACGAKSVVGVEARPELVDHAVANLEALRPGPGRFRFIVGDVHEVLRSEDLDVDVVLCLGFLYHTLRFNELLNGIHRTGAHHLRTRHPGAAHAGPRPVGPAAQRAERAQGGRRKRTSTRSAPSVLTGRPNLAAIRLMLGCYG